MTAKQKCLTILLLLPLLLTSCVDFDDQTASYHYDRDKDELRIFQVYRRIHNSKGKPLGKKEIAQLTEVLEDQATFFFDNWIFLYRRQNSRKNIERLKKQLAQADKTRAAEIEAEIDFHQTVIESVRVQNGDFFLNEKKELCGYQAVTVSNASQLIEKGNHGIDLLVRGKEFLQQFDSASQKQILAAADGGDWIRLEGNRFTIRFPLPVKEYDEAEETWRELKAKGALADYQYQKPFARLVFGDKDASPAVVRIADRQGKYNEHVHDWVKDRYPIKEKVDLSKLRAEFLKTGKFVKSK